MCNSDVSDSDLSDNPAIDPRIFVPTRDISEPLARTLRNTIQDGAAGLTHLVGAQKLWDVDCLLSPDLESSTIIVSIQGLAEDIRTSSAQAAYAVHFGERSQYNQTGLLPNAIKQYQLEALQYAVNTVIIRTSPEPVFNLFTDYVWHWEPPGFLTNGSKNRHRALAEEIHVMIKDCMKGSRLNIKIWLVHSGHKYRPMFLLKWFRNRAENTAQEPASG
ncbi:uncharacterized protein PAC_03631 [Phialocephala subalpina]|uniref:Uncharacterized protein n=1 Tax=Phialocephala subalpina TaxID=576137 RepID=A0A1L7WLW9_9HELO|nr:uncharacterized protein PAC_03631 [Phialocephala subalpina]